jgi:hypothetical protein
MATAKLSAAVFHIFARLPRELATKPQSTCGYALATAHWNWGDRSGATEKGPLITRLSDIPGLVLDFASGAKAKYGWAVWSWRPAACMTGLSLALTLAAAGVYSDAASALEATVVAPAPSAQWCLDRRDGNSDQPACYASLITCVMAALAHASWCIHRVPESVVAMNRRAPAVASLPRHRRHASPGQHKFTAAERDDLYQAFEKWKERSPGE